MTGGQSIGDNWNTVQIANQVLSEGVIVVILCEDLKTYQNVRLPQNVEIKHRDYLQNVQNNLKSISGVSVLIMTKVVLQKREGKEKGFN